MGDPEFLNLAETLHPTTGVPLVARVVLLYFRA